MNFLINAKNNKKYTLPIITAMYPGKASNAFYFIFVDLCIPQAAIQIIV